MIRKSSEFIHTCTNCKTVFINRYRNRKYCSQKCYNETKSFIIKCFLCGEEFEAKTYNVKICVKCRTKKCKECGKIFVVPSADILGTKFNRPRKYCSQNCYHKATIGKVAYNKEEGIDVICSICGKKFNVWKSRVKTAKYCSWECFNEAKSRVTNVNHPLWKGGHDLYSRLLSESEGSFWRNRKIVLKRDNNTCQYCGFKGESNYMDVHHIIKVKELGASLPENMITLCRKCHNNADRGYISIEFLQEKVLELY